MRQMVERLRTGISDFIAQRDDLTLVVRCSEPDCGLVTKILEGLDESSASELYWVVIEPFRNAPAFVDACVASFATRHAAVRLALQKQGLPPWPELPGRVVDPAGLPPVERLKQLIIFSRSLLPTLSGCGVVWGLLPMQIANAPAYAEFMSSLWRHEFPFPWSHHVRMIVRDDLEAPVLAAQAEAAPRVAVCTADFSPDAIRRGLEEEAGDDRMPLGDRVNSCLMLAGIDYSHGRYDRAIQQYDVVHQYAAATQNPTLAAIALNGMGDVLRAQGKTAEAGHIMQMAIAPAALAPAPPVPVLLDLYLKLGELRHSQQRWQEAEVFLQGAADFAYLLHDPDHRLRCLRLLGDTQYQQGKTTPALKTWFAGAVVAGKLGKDGDHDGFVQHLRNHYVRLDAEADLAPVMTRIHQEIAAHDPDTAP